MKKQINYKSLSVAGGAKEHPQFMVSSSSAQSKDQRSPSAQA